MCWRFDHDCQFNWLFARGRLIISIIDFFDVDCSRRISVSLAAIDRCLCDSFADRIDINEEMSRLSDHMRKFRETAKEKGQIGKKLDFIAQEMFREANTIGSKTPSSDIAHRAVEIKNNIEKIREQCRNVV